MSFLNLKIERRPSYSTARLLLVLILAIIAAFAVNAFFAYAFLRVNPLLVIKTIFSGAFGSYIGITETLTKTIPILLCGLGAVIAFKCGVFNIGLEGQLAVGAIMTAGLGFTLHLPFPIFIILLVLAGFLAGAAWAAIPGFLSAKYGGLNEVVTTIMMNYIALLFLSYLVNGPWNDPLAYQPRSPLISLSAILPRLPRSSLHLGFIIAILCVVLVYIFLNKTIQGYRIRGVGSNPVAARYGGIRITKNVMIAMSISGGLAGLAGMLEVSGIHHLLMEGMTGGYGYIGLMAAMIGRLHPIGVLLGSIFFGVCIVGGESLKRVTAVPHTLVISIQSMATIFVLIAGVAVRYRIRRVRKWKK